ncbi:RepB family plasmid replication initiator protein [Duganella violaceipulchra]|uniref:Initiator Rep protein WH1 domain-containing protein n=1 Tax=Duganella violaceipulchra TaxID=2849652 RepID=A0AA41LB34_9BURK|nr:RepB family plasmid replication initiator protein [Duganella violaceicalia]MBV6324895.1 hypothetical protein [Duganella violaceicalia]MCP2012356.1 hypothetical protein [Duganella violaceicalia]
MPAETIEILPPVQAEEERERIRQQALVDSARNLSIDERYVLRRLVNLVAQDPDTASRPAGKLITVSVIEFAAHAGITFKVARRRLDMAAYALFERSVSIHFHDEGTIFCWAEKLGYTEDYYELRFSSTFIRYLEWIVGDIRAGASRPLISFAEAINAPAVVARGAKVPGDLSIVHISRLKARTKRPKSMKWWQLRERVEKRLKQLLSRDEVLDVLDAADQKSPLAKMRGKYYDYSHRDIAGLYDWIMKNKDKPDFMEF